MPFQVNIHSKVEAAASTSYDSCSKNNNSCTPFSIPGLSKKSPKDAFLASYDVIRERLLKDLDETTEIDEHRRKYLGLVMDRNCLGGKYNRGICVVEIARQCLHSTKSSYTETRLDEILFGACVLGWCIEFLQAHFLVEDDIMDGSETRRGKPCWYKHKGVSTAVAINDGLIIMAWCTRMIELFLSWHPNKPEFFTILHKVDFLTTIGQLYDTTSVYDSAKLNPDQECPTTTDFKEFTLRTYNRIVKYKTAFYTYHCPMLFGLAVTSMSNTVDQKLVEETAVAMGEYFQIQDDFLDCFGDPSVTGKIGTDIEDNKCSWLACTFLQNKAEDQKAISTFKSNYGQKEPEKVKIIKQLYRDAKLVETFEKHEESVVEQVIANLKTFKSQNPDFADALQPLWERTYKRQK